MFKQSCTSVEFLRGTVWFPLWSNVITLARNRVNDRDRDVSTEETARIFSSLIGLPALAKKGHVRRTYSVPVCGFFDKQSIRG